MTHPEPCDRHTSTEHDTAEALLRRLAVGLDLPPWLLGLGAPPLSSSHRGPWRHRLRWRLALAVDAAADWLGDKLAWAGDRVDDAGDWLAARIEPPAPPPATPFRPRGHRLAPAVVGRTVRRWR